MTNNMIYIEISNILDLNAILRTAYLPLLTEEG